jgi:hypothetical protein
MQILEEFQMGHYPGSLCKRQKLVSTLAGRRATELYGPT